MNRRRATACSRPKRPRALRCRRRPFRRCVDVIGDTSASSLNSSEADMGLAMGIVAKPMLSGVHLDFAVDKKTIYDPSLA